MVGTKVDLVDERKVPMEEVIEFIHKNNLKYLEISSKDGYNINLLFLILTEIILLNMQFCHRKKIENSNMIIKNKNININEKVDDNSCCAIM